MKKRTKLVNLGAYKNRVFHFDFENNLLLEEEQTQNYWSYILVPITVFVLRILLGIIEKTNLFENSSTRIILSILLIGFSYLLAQYVTNRYQSGLRLREYTLDESARIHFVKTLKVRRVVFLLIKLIIYLVILLSTFLFIGGYTGDVFLILLVSLLALFLLNADYQLKKWPSVIQKLELE
ncbi:hypothetical protein ACVRXQ_13030 [Streptococcus panodentis]|uniref:DUF443 family protein n=1 Tax=Streptococcus panodentis TaxID=1581472 RepID=A0ABS5B065_9STRE|nr:hypothetical protein [Streptococcus panodentis]MBP2622215.1 hypothetical protein [Streptococcus panodentis]